MHLLLVMIFGSAGLFAAPSASYLDLNLRQNRYLGAIQHAAQSSNYTLLHVDLNLESESEGFAYKLNPVAQGALDADDEVYFGVPEMFVEPKKIAPWFNLTIGRQKRQWSKLDDEFDLGIWQPQLRWDYLAPEQQGLTGVFFDWSLSSAVRLSFFTSPLHIPDQGPQFKLRDGTFHSANRWFVQPQSRVQLFQGTPYSSEAPLYYELNEPSIEELTLHSSFGLGLRYQEPLSPIWTQINYAYKPRNQIHLGIQCANCMDISDSDDVTAVIHATTVKHHVITLETGFDRVDDQGWVSINMDVPGKSGFPDEYAEAPLNSMLVAGLGFKHYVRSWIGKPSWLSYTYMRAWQFEMNDEAGGLLGNDQVESSFDRYPFEEVAAVEWRLQLSQAKRNLLHWRNRYSYSIPEQGGWLSSTLDWTYDRTVWSLGIDVLGAGVDPADPRAGLFSRYRSNDRVYGGMTYVF